jgi:nitroreductase
MSQDNNELRIDYDICSTCGQCVAICPQEALSWDHVPPVKYNRDLLPGPDQLDELFKERRTIRDFTSDKIGKGLLEEVANYAVYSPSHSFAFRTLLIDHESVIQQIDRTIFRYSSRIHRYFYKPKFFLTIVRLFTPDRVHEYLKAKPKLEAALKRGRNFKTLPPAILMIIADIRIPLSVESAQYALYSVNLYAHTKGLGCRNLVGNQMFLNRSGSIRKLLGLKRQERIAGTMALGYSAVRFRNKVEGRKTDLAWLD